MRSSFTDVAPERKLQLTELRFGNMVIQRREDDWVIKNGKYVLNAKTERWEFELFSKIENTHLSLDEAIAKSVIMQTRHDCNIMTCPSAIRCLFGRTNITLTSFNQFDK